MVDDSSQTELSIDARRAAEAEMRKRDRRAGRIPAALDGMYRGNPVGQQSLLFTAALFHRGLLC
jgi:hypothetical protein